MILRNILLPGILVPLGAALSMLVLSSLLRRRFGTMRFVPRGGELSLCVAFLAAFVALTSWPRFLPVEATQRLFFFVVLSLVLSCMVRRLPHHLRLMAVWVFSLPTTALLLQAQIEYRWSAPASVLWVASIATMAVLIAWSWTRSLQTEPKTTVVVRSDPSTSFNPSALSYSRWEAGIRPALLGGTALCLGLSGSALLGQLMGALAVAAATIEAWQIFRHEPVWRKSDALSWTTPVGGLILIASFYADLAPVPAALLIASFLLLGCNHETTSTTVRFACLVPLVIAMTLVMWAELNQGNDEYDEYNYSSSVNLVPASTSDVDPLPTPGA